MPAIVSSSPLKLAVLLVAMLAFLGVALWGVDLRAAAEALAHTRWLLVAGVFATYVGGHAIRAARLGVLLRHAAPFRRLFAINAIGFLAINTLPLRLGETVRPYLMGTRAGIPLGTAVSAIVIERLLDMVALLLLLVGVPWLAPMAGHGLIVDGVDVLAGGRAFALTMAGAAVGGAIALILFAPSLSRFESLPGGRRLVAFARQFREGALSLAQTPSRALHAAVLTLAIWVTSLGAVALALAAYPGVPTSLGAAWMTLSATTAGATVLPTPGFFGGFELAGRAGLWVFGVPGATAGTFALVLHLIQLAFVVSTGLTMLIAEGLSPRDVLAAVRRPTPSTDPGSQG